MKYYLSLFLLFATIQLNSQTKYISISPSVFLNSPGSFKDKAMATVEVGKTWDPVSVGVAVGRMNFTKQPGVDTVWYLELRTTYNVLLKNDFFAGISFGTGHIFNAKESFLTEFSYNMGYSINQSVSVSLFQGLYFSGEGLRYWFSGAGLTLNFPKIFSNQKTK